MNGITSYVILLYEKTDPERIALTINSRVFPFSLFLLSFPFKFFNFLITFLYKATTRVKNKIDYLT